MCRVPGSIDPPSPAFGILSSAWRHAADPQELLELLFYRRREPRARIARPDTSIDSLYRSIVELYVYYYIYIIYLYVINITVFN